MYFDMLADLVCYVIKNTEINFAPEHSLCGIANLEMRGDTF